MTDEQLRDDILKLDVKHPSDLWAHLTGVHILDFDGYPEEGSWVLPVTFHEFMERAAKCTVEGGTLRIISEYFEGGGRSASTYRVSTREKMPVLGAPKWLRDRMDRIRAMPPVERGEIAAQFAAGRLARQLDDTL